MLCTGIPQVKNQSKLLLYTVFESCMALRDTKYCCLAVQKSTKYKLTHSYLERGGRVVRWSWVNFQCRGVLLIWIIVGQGPTALAIGAGGGCLVYLFSLLFPSFWETARYRLKYCLKGPLNPKQPTNHILPRNPYRTRYIGKQCRSRSDAT